MRLIFGHDAVVKRWVTERIDFSPDFNPGTTIGVAPNDEDILIAGIVYHDFQEKFGTIQISMAADSPRWAQRGIIRACLHYPFEQLGVGKVWTAIASDNRRAIRFNEGIGLRREAILSRHFGSKHAVICRMLRKEYDRLYTMKEAA